MSKQINDLITNTVYKGGANNPHVDAVVTKYDLELKTSEISDSVNLIANGIVQADSTAVDVAGIVVDFNILLADLRTAGLLA